MPSLPITTNYHSDFRPLARSPVLPGRPRSHTASEAATNAPTASVQLSYHAPPPPFAPSPPVTTLDTACNGIGETGGGALEISVEAGVLVAVDVGVLAAIGMAVLVAVGVDVLVGLGVSVLVAVSVGVPVGLGVGMLFSVGVGVLVSLGVGVLVAVGVTVLIGLGAGVSVGKMITMGGAGLSVGVAVPVGVGVGVGVAVAVLVGVGVGVGVGVAVLVGVSVGVGVGVCVGPDPSGRRRQALDGAARGVGFWYDRPTIKRAPCANREAVADRAKTWAVASPVFQDQVGADQGGDHTHSSRAPSKLRVVRFGRHVGT